MESHFPFPANLFDHIPSSQRPDPSDVKNLAAPARLHTDDDGLGLLIHRPLTPSCDHSTLIYVPLLVRIWSMNVCLSDASCHREVHRTLHMLERFNCWIGMDIYT